MSVIERIEVSVQPEKARKWLEKGSILDKPVEHTFEKDWYVESMNFCDGVYLATLISCRQPTALDGETTDES